VIRCFGASVPKPPSLGRGPMVFGALVFRDFSPETALAPYCHPERSEGLPASGGDHAVVVFPVFRDFQSRDESAEDGFIRTARIT